MKTIIFISLLVTFIQASEFHLNKLQEEYVNKHNPELLKKYKETLDDANGKKKVYAIFAFVSESVPQKTIDEYTNTMRLFISKDVKSGIYFNGVDSETYATIRKTLNNSYKKQFNTFVKFDPNFFQKYKINKVPLLSLSICNKNDIYPSDCKVLFLIHGTLDTNYFARRIVKENKIYEIILKKKE